MFRPAAQSEAVTGPDADAPRDRRADADFVPAIRRSAMEAEERIEVDTVEGADELVVIERIEHIGFDTPVVVTHAKAQAHVVVAPPS